MYEKRWKINREGKNKQDILVKNVTVPYLKSNGFTLKRGRIFKRSGIKYIKELKYFVAEAEIHLRKFTKIDEIENFRINIRLYSKKSYNLLYRSISFGDFSIMGENTWITTDKYSNIDELAAWLKLELDKIPDNLKKYDDIDTIIEEERTAFRHDGTGYALLLFDNGREEEYTLWLENANKKLSGELEINEERLDYIKRFLMQIDMLIKAGDE